MSIRVLHLVKTSHGASWAVQQVRQLVKLGVEVHVAAPPGGPRIAEYKAAGATVYEEQFDLPLWEFWVIRSEQMKEISLYCQALFRGRNAMCCMVPPRGNIIYRA